MNGDIVIWDLNRATQKQELTLSEYDRAVNRLSFHKTEPNLLLSAGQDGTIKLWDLRTKTGASGGGNRGAWNGSKATFDGKSENVRDVQFSPVSPYEFIAAFENGSIQVSLLSFSPIKRLRLCCTALF
jgi:WD40 repeat protein